MTVKRSVLGLGVLLAALLAVQTQGISYVDPDGGDPNVNLLFTGSVLMDPVPGISLGDVYVDYWAFTHTGDAGYFYAYRVRNVSGTSVSGNPGAITFFEIKDLLPFTVLGNGGGKGTGVTYGAWGFNGDGTIGEMSWQGASSKSIRPGGASPNVLDAEAMFEIHSIYAPASGIQWITTTSGGGYSGQNAGVYVPGIVPEPGTIAAVATGLLSLVGLRARRK